MKVPRSIEDLVPYQPGKPIEETQRELGLTKVAKLASNENPLGPSPKVRAALGKAIDQLHRYPDAAAYELRQSYSKLIGVSPEQIVFSNGSNESIDLLIKVFCQPGDEVLTFQGAFIAYKISAQSEQVFARELPLRENLSFKIEALVEFLKTEDSARTRLIFLPNPNNPTGSFFTQSEYDQIWELIQQRENTLLVIDEAYIDYVEAEDFPRALDSLTKTAPLAILRTMSKAYGLAGIRLGALISNPQVIDWVNRVRNPFNVNTFAQIGGLAAFEDSSFLKESVRVNRNGLEELRNFLKDFSVQVYPSQGNFLLVDFKRDSQEVFQYFLKRGVILRPVKNYGLPTQVRISVGTSEENQMFMDVFQKYSTEEGFE